MLKILQQFSLDSSPVSCERYGNGHINETYLVVCASSRRYILQKINNTIFKDVPALMENIASVTAFLARKDSDPRHVLHLVPTVSGNSYLEMDGGFYRVYDFVEDSLCLDRVETKEDFYYSAVAFGDFQCQLADFPAHTLHETIPRFHDTANRMAIFRQALEQDVMGRASSVQDLVEFALAHEEEAGSMVAMLKAGELPLRVTHNDTKLNNVMLDAQTRRPLCVIDLDTVMPGLAANDFGDSIRFGASTAAEDEKNLDLVQFSLPLFEAYSKGFLSACGSALTKKEIETLHLGARLMTLECGVRFLTDYLQGDTYFRIHRPEHNLDRTRTQFKLVAEMEKAENSMVNIIGEAARTASR